MNVETITASQLADIVKNGGTIDLIDVRTPREFEEIRIEFARNLPLEHLDADLLAKERNGNEPLYVICKSGTRGKAACEKFLKAGLDAVYNIEGGTLAAVEAGLPIRRGRKAFAVDRQMRIVAGTLTLAGAVLGAFVHPAFIGLSAFIGGGLIFAGVTDYCPMMTMIARMPWNQTSAPAKPCNTGAC
jgi:rhodanese-related sulfurtransferase